MKNLLTALAALALAGSAVAAPQPGAEPAKPVMVLPPGHVPVSAVPAAIPLVHKGKVLEVVDSGAYTYLKVAGDKNPVWLAAYKIIIAKGATVSYSDGVAMSNFHSKSLNRTFETIIFVDRIEVEKK